MKKKLKGAYLLVSSLLIGLVNLPFAFAKSASGTNKLFLDPTPAPAPAPMPAPADAADKNTGNSVRTMPVARSVYDSLHLDLKGLSRDAFEYAKKGFDKLMDEGRLANNSIISIIDFSLPSNQKRLFIMDLDNYKVLFHTLVAHGQNTGREWATSFSNQNESHKSSPGFYITEGTYEGKNGYSLKLTGIESGINDKAYERGIVIHGADYVSADIANARGYIGRSHGCPAVSPQLSRPIINTIKNGTCLFIYHPSYIRRSQVLR